MRTATALVIAAALTMPPAAATGAAPGAAPDTANEVNAVAPDAAATNEVIADPANGVVADPLAMPPPVADPMAAPEPVAPARADDRDGRFPWGLLGLLGLVGLLGRNRRTRAD